VNTDAPDLEKIDQHYELLKEMTIGNQVWMSHGDTIAELPEQFINIASTEDVENAAFKIRW
jgi:GMP synthase (glutamine-hydrolysing)